MIHLPRSREPFFGPGLWPIVFMLAAALALTWLLKPPIQRGVSWVFWQVAETPPTPFEEKCWRYDLYCPEARIRPPGFESAAAGDEEPFVPRDCRLYAKYGLPVPADCN